MILYAFVQPIHCITKKALVLYPSNYNAAPYQITRLLPLCCLNIQTKKTPNWSIMIIKLSQGDFNQSICSQPDYNLF